VSSSAESPVQFTGGDQLGELGRFLQELHGSIEMRAQWRDNRDVLIETVELTVETRTFLKSNPDPTQVRARLQAEVGPGNQTWICIWIRS
jgi:hypothetical protein